MASEPEKKKKRSDMSYVLEKVLNNMQECIFWKDTERRFAGVNKAFLDYYGFESDEGLIGVRVEEADWHQSPESFMEDDLAVLKGEVITKIHGKCMVKGEMRDLLVSKTPVYDDGKIIGLVGSFLDVTESLRKEREIEALQKKLEKALRSERKANRKNADLVARLRLEMKNPLDAIHSISYMDRYATDPEVLSFDMRRIHAASNYLTTLSKDLIDINAIETGNLELEEKECAFEMIVDGIETVIRPMVEEKGLSFTVQREYDRTKRLVCDPGRVQQIAINLLMNAVRFTDRGSVRFLVKAKEDGEAWKVTYVIQDTGCGMGEDFLPKMYDEFAREKRNPNKYGKGAGLGLTMVKRLVDLLGGEISVDSEVNFGTTFTVKFVL